MKDKKILFIILVFLFLPTGVSARLADPDRFPKYEPLLPPQENIMPNYSGSINFSAEPASETGEASAQNLGEPVPAGEADNAKVQAGAGEASLPEARGQASLWIVLLAVLAISLVYGIRRWKSTKKL